MHSSRCFTVTLLFIWSLFCGDVLALKQNESRPNIVFFLIDDYGHTDIGYRLTD